MFLRYAIEVAGEAALFQAAQHHLPLHPLNGAAPDADHRRHIQDALPGVQMRPDGVLDLGRHLGAAELLPLQHRIEYGTLIAAFGTTDALVLVGLDDKTTENQRLVLARMAGHRGWPMLTDAIKPGHDAINGGSIFPALQKPTPSNVEPRDHPHPGPGRLI